MPIFWSLSQLSVDDKKYKYYSLKKVAKEYGCDLSRLPYSIKILVENAIRNKDDINITEDSIKGLLGWGEADGRLDLEIMYKPFRVLMQDFTGIPAVVDLASMREAAKNAGRDFTKINPTSQTHIVIDHSIQVDHHGEDDALEKNTKIDFERNMERYQFLKWAQGSFSNFHVIPPGIGICHQINIEKIAQVCCVEDNFIFPDTVVGTDSHTTMANGLGIMAWGVGGIEAETVMLGQYISLLVPEVLGVKLSGKIMAGITATDLALTITQILRAKNVVGKIVEFFGEGLNYLSTEDRATIANMAPEYGATCGMFPVDNETLNYLRLTGREESHIKLVEQYTKEEGLFRDEDASEFVIYSDKIEINLSEVKPSIAGPKRPQDKILLKDVPSESRIHISAENAGTVFETDRLIVKVIKESNFEDLAGVLQGVRDRNLFYSEPKYEAEKIINHYEFFGISKFLIYTKDGGGAIGIGGVISNDPKWGKEILGQFKDPLMLCDIISSSRGSGYKKEFLLGLRDWVYEESRFSEAFIVPFLSTDDTIDDSIFNDLGITYYSSVNHNNITVKMYLMTDVKDRKSREITNGSIVIAAITSCTNTSNPASMIAAGLVAKKASKLGLTTKPYVKTSLAPGSRVAQDYLKNARLQKYLDNLGFNIVGFGCTTCIGNSGPLNEGVTEEVKRRNLSVASVLSGNRNFEGRIHPLVKMNFLASPALVVAYAIAGNLDVDLVNGIVGTTKGGTKVKLSEIWPSTSEVKEVVSACVTKDIFISKYKDIYSGDNSWKGVDVNSSELYSWTDSSYIKNPPYFDGVDLSTNYDKNIDGIIDARPLLYLGNSITTDHISPAGSIAKGSPASKYLESVGVSEAYYNSYGARRGNHEVMVRGTFANIRIKNKLLEDRGNIEGGYGICPETKKVDDVFSISEKYAKSNIPLIVIAGKEYGTGSSRDWAAKGTSLLGVRAVIAESFERIHRTNLVGMGVMPFQFQDKDALKDIPIKYDTKFSIVGISDLKPRSEVMLKIVDPDGTVTNVGLIFRVDTNFELSHIKNGGILQSALINLLG